MRRLRGHLYDGRSSRQREALLGVLADGNAELSCGRERTRLSLSAVEVSERIGATPRRITLPDGRIFETPDNDAVDALLRDLPSGRARDTLHRLESSLPLIALAVGCAVAVVWFLAAAGLPSLAREAAYALPADFLGGGCYDVARRLASGIHTSMYEIPRFAQAK